jgi:succinate dehydrogenase / fumarate reductase membrane anchor subunit
MSDLDMRTPMRRVRGLGSARSGTTHFWHQRITSVAGVILSLIAIPIVFATIGRNHAAAVQIIGSPFGAVFLLLFVFNMTYHMWLGMQVVIEDYVHHEIRKFVLLMGNTFLSILIAVFCAFAILKLSFGV